MNKRKVKKCLISVILCSMMMCWCTACAAKDGEKAEMSEVSQSQGEEADVPMVSEDQEQEAEVSTQNEVPFVEVNGVVIKIGDDLSVMVDSLGEPDDYQAAKSCIGEGDEKIYEYGGISIYTTPSGDQDLVYILELAGEEKLSSGIGLESSKQDVIDVYGENYTEDGNYMYYEYDDGSITLGFEFEGDTVNFIEVYGTL